MPRLLLLLSLVVLQACSADPVEDAVLDSAKAPVRITDYPLDITEYVATAADFDCILNTAEAGADPQTGWHQVRNFYLKNMAGRTQEALDVARGVQPGPYPMGTVIQLIFFEAMVKRGGDYSPVSKGWEFFALNVEEGKSTIETRGNAEVVNFADGNCFDCHRKARPEFDLVCESGHGCDPLGVDSNFIQKMQQGDPRCKL